MVLEKIISAQKRGERMGIPSICSAHPWVIKTAMRVGGTVLIESTCNQVNQFGGYTGMTPAAFMRFVNQIAQEQGFPMENVILGGDHLGPNAWQSEKSDQAMVKSEELIKDYVQAGFQKIHLDCSMRLADDHEGPLDLNLAASRTARLVEVAEFCRPDKFQPNLYVIGTEVPIPGGAQKHEGGVNITRVEDARQTIDCMQRAFIKRGLESAWERVIALVVQPGVEFGDDFVLDYDPQKTWELVQFIKSQPLVFEAHSTDYQTEKKLADLVKDHFAILKVGPALTFAFREAVFGLAMIENDYFPVEKRSRLIETLDEVMIQNPEYWHKYFYGNSEEIKLARKYSLSDRVRYYWSHPLIINTLNVMLENLSTKSIPYNFLNRFFPALADHVRLTKKTITPEEIIEENIKEVLHRYHAACRLSQVS